MQPHNPERAFVQLFRRIIVAVIASFVLAIVLFTVATGAGWGPWAVAILPVMVLLGVAVGVFGPKLAPGLSEALSGGSRVGRPTIELSHQQVAPGESLTVHYTCPVRSETSSMPLVFELVLREVAVRHDRDPITGRKRTMSTTTTHDNVVARQEYPGQILARGALVSQSATFEIPRYGMHSFESPDNLLAWLVRVRLGTPGLHLTDDEIPFVVLPERR